MHEVIAIKTTMKLASGLKSESIINVGSSVEKTPGTFNYFVNNKVTVTNNPKS